MTTLNLRAWLGLAFLALVMGLMLFAAAGTVRYWPAWGYLAAFFGSAVLVTLYLARNDPALLERRLRAGPAAEKQQSQKVITTFASIGFIGLLVVPALDHRFAWSSVPLSAILAGDMLTLLSFYAIFLVYRANTFTSATIEVAAHQKVIASGPYAVVRHPMYAGSLPLLVGTPLALGSYWGLLALAAMTPALIWRLFAEERFPSRNLPGYREYCAKVRWRLIPGVF
jgi:protein-S-isoprenylcysteine O-methyltransferase Ste14